MTGKFTSYVNPCTAFAHVLCAWRSEKPPHVYVEKVGINRGQIGNLPCVIDWCYDQ